MKKSKTEEKTKTSDSEELSENSYESSNDGNDDLEKITDNLTCLKPYQFEPEREMITDSEKGKEDFQKKVIVKTKI